MPRFKLFVVLAAFAVSAAMNSPGLARGGSSGGRSSGHSGGHNGGHGGGHGHGRTSVGVFFGPAWYPPYYYYPYPPYYPYYYPPVVTAPPTYIEQAPPQALSPGYWYYCEGSNAYYPYVKECAGSWQPVAPTPAQ
jgi:hypothetical protein